MNSKLNILKEIFKNRHIIVKMLKIKDKGKTPTKSGRKNNASQGDPNKMNKILIIRKIG